MEVIFWASVLTTICFSEAQHIVIVGGGVSGLSAAYKLCKSDLCNITLLEAENRLGGRLYTVDYKGMKLEIGAAYVHEPEGNTVYEFMSKKINLDEDVRRATLMDDNWALKPAFVSGKTVSPDIADLLDRSTFLDDSIEYVNQKIDKENVSPGDLKDVSVFDVVLEFWKKKYLKGRNINSSDAEAVFKYNLLEMNICDGGSTYDTGILESYYYKYFEGPDVRITTGYSILIDILTETIPESVIKLNSKVKSIRWSGTSQNFDVQNEKFQVIFTDDKGRESDLDADYVIFTPSLGYLKANHLSLFVPSLSSEKQRAIDTIGFGIINKIYLYYETKFWNEDDFPIAILWDSYEGQDVFSDPDHWTRYLYLWEEYEDNMLVVWINATTSRIISDMSEAEIGSTLTQLLRKLKNNNLLPEPDDVILTQWNDKENFLGSYSYFAVGETIKDRETLSEPLYVDGIPRVLFAGEATHVARHGTIDGAFMSGIREADRIIEFEKSGLEELKEKRNEAMINVYMFVAKILQFLRENSQ